MIMDVLQRDDLHFPHSLPEFQQLFPDNALLAQPIWKGLGGALGLSAPTAKYPESLIDSLTARTFFVAVSANAIPD